VWALRALGASSAQRVYGPDLTPWICAEAVRQNVAVGFYGGTPEVLQTLSRRLRERFPGLRIDFQFSPPFRPLDAQEDEDLVARINASGVRILFVGLGCPKQERWMAEHHGRIDCVMVGVGAAFDFLAGHKRQAPPALQRIGMEWLFRLAVEPKRLWKRYLHNNPRFVLLFATQLLRAFAGKQAGSGPANAADAP
jgi:N-acetylglucosaminyldiphosphoundecaprenol N-acetyl-beta-D-mannosaminyltransferase